MNKPRQTMPVLAFLFLLIIIPILVTQSTVDGSETIEKIRAFSREQEFDYAEWEISAIWEKLIQTSLGLPRRISVPEGRIIIDETLTLNNQIRYTEWQINQIYSNPEIDDPELESQTLKEDLSTFNAEHQFKASVTEALLQSQINQSLAEEGISIFGQAFPPVMYRFSPLPKALIVSPRDVIRQDANLSLHPEITFDQIIGVEDSLTNALNVSTLITDIGGVGTYPSMVYQTSNLEWLLNTVAHEWTHNYLTLHPLGINYGTSGETRTMNETTADIVGEVVMLQALRIYYPELLPEEQTDTSPPSVELDSPEEEADVFDFAYEMYITRSETDKLLEEGNVDEAEDYMESRRQLFWDNGYQIRKLNQAYFAFHSAYVNAPSTGGEGQTGAAGEDPVGPAVWKLFEKTNNLGTFLRQIAWITSFEELQNNIAEQ